MTDNIKTPLQLSAVAKEYYTRCAGRNAYGLEKYVVTDGNRSMFVKSDYQPNPGEAVFYVKKVNAGNDPFCQLYKLPNSTE